MKRIFIVSTMAVMAGLFASCEKDPQGTSEDKTPSTVYLTTGLPMSDQVYYTINYTELTGKYDTTGTNVISLKLAALAEVSNAVKGTLKADFTKVPADWTAMPEGAFALTNATSEIAENAKEGTESFVVTLDTDKMADAGNYALPLTIEITGENAVLSETANTVIVKFVRTVQGGASDGWSKIASDRYTAGALANYVGIDYSDYGMGVAAAFDNDLTTGWYGTTYYSYTDDDGNTQYVYANDYSYDYGCFAEVVFNEPTALRGLVISVDPEGDYYKWYSPRRLSIMFKYEGDDDYTWDKPYSDGNVYDDEGNVTGTDENEDEKSFTFCPMLTGDEEIIPGYKPSAADFMITNPNYSAFEFDFSEKLAGKKVSAMIICPATLYGYQNGWNEEKQDFNYTYLYDVWDGTCVNEFTLFE